MTEPTQPSPQAREVPEELLNQLHAATEHFHESKKRHEETLQASEYRHEERIDHAREQLRVAERELEEITSKIKNELDKPRQ